MSDVDYIKAYIDNNTKVDYDVKKLQPIGEWQMTSFYYDPYTYTIYCVLHNNDGTVYVYAYCKHTTQGKFCLENGKVIEYKYEPFKNLEYGDRFKLKDDDGRLYLKANVGEGYNAVYTDFKTFKFVSFDDYTVVKRM